MLLPRERENVPVVGVTGSQVDERLSLELMMCRLESYWKLAWDGLGAREWRLDRVDAILAAEDAVDSCVDVLLALELVRLGTEAELWLDGAGLGWR